MPDNAPAERTDMKRLLLDLRDAIADKEWVIACANMQTASADAWTCDWHQGMREAQQHIDAVRAAIDAAMDEETT